MASSQSAMAATDACVIFFSVINFRNTSQSNFTPSTVIYDFALLLFIMPKMRAFGVTVIVCLLEKVA
jgi:hypothetical protein